MNKLKFNIKGFFKMPMILVFVFIVLVFGGIALGKNSEINTYAIVSAIGIDKEGPDTKLSLLTFEPMVEENFKDSYKIITSVGKTMTEALSNASVHIGREIGLSHVKTIIIDSEIFESNAADAIDFVARSKEIPLSTSLICANGGALQLLESMKSLDNDGSIKAENLVNFNERYAHAEASSIESFYSGLNSPSKSSTISYIKVDTTSGIETGSGSSGESGSSQSQEDKKIDNVGDTILCKDGKCVAFLNHKDMQKINFLKGNFDSGSIVMEHFYNEKFEDATLSFEIEGNRLYKKIRYINGVPVVYFDIKLNVKLKEVCCNTSKISIENDSLSDSVKRGLETHIKSMANEGLEILKINKCDLIGIYELLNNQNHKEFKKFLDSLDDKEDYLSNIVFKLSIDLYSN